MRLFTCLLAFGCLSLSLTACTDALGPGEAPPEGLFDDSPLLPALSAAEAEAWQWIPTDGMQCRDGSDTGFGLRRAAGSRDLLILLQGGGACFDFLTCLLNPSRYGEANFTEEIAQIGERGVFSPTEPANPFLGWNVVYVPYCTGDVHSGNATNVRVPGAGQQDFVGYRNLEALLDVVGGPARRARHVVLSGVSAGGFGTIGTYGLARAASPRPPSTSSTTPARPTAPTTCSAPASRRGGAPSGRSATRSRPAAPTASATRPTATAWSTPSRTTPPRTRSAPSASCPTSATPSSAPSSAA